MVMNLGEAKEVFFNHLKELMKNSRDGDRTVKALRLINDHLNQTIYDENEIEKENSREYSTIRYYEGGLLVKEEIKMRGE